MALIAEDLLVLLLDAAGGWDRRVPVPVALGAALVVELATAGTVALGEPTGLVVPSAKVMATGPPPTDPLLASAHALVRSKPRSTPDLVAALTPGLVQRVARRLVAGGVLDVRRERRLGVLTRTRWAPVDLGHRQRVERSVAAPDPDVHSRALGVLLGALDGSPGGQWPDETSAEVVAAARDAVVAAVAAATTGGTRVRPSEPPS